MTPNTSEIIEALRYIEDYFRDRGKPDCRLAIHAAINLIERLLRGDFTPEELQGLCHNLSEDDKTAFCNGCEAYQIKLFGSSPTAQDARRYRFLRRWADNLKGAWWLPHFSGPKLGEDQNDRAHLDQQVDARMAHYVEQGHPIE